MYKITSETTIKGELKTLWAVVTDVNHWSDWDPHEEQARLDGAFVVGGTGWSKPHGGPGTAWTITQMVEQRLWASECPLPGGKLTGENTFESLPDGRIRCTKTVRVYGPLVLLFWLYFGRGIRRDMDKSWTALEQEVARRQATTA
jgi:hypothetical protein